MWTQWHYNIAICVWSLYSTVVLYIRDHGGLPQNITTLYFLCTSLTALARHSQIQKCLQIILSLHPPNKLLWNLIFFLFYMCSGMVFDKALLAQCVHKMAHTPNGFCSIFLCTRSTLWLILYKHELIGLVVVYYQQSSVSLGWASLAQNLNIYQKPFWYTHVANRDQMTDQLLFHDLTNHIS